MPRKQAGFTLVEIAIVLVIIGLLLGGVLKGQELITQAKIKNLANDLNGISAAIYAYQDRYKAYPGDDLNAGGASGRWTTKTTSGNGNGQVEGAFDSDTATKESRLFWQHLRLSGLIGGDTTSTAQPQNAVGGILGVQVNAGVTATPDLSGLVVCTSNLLGKLAEALDNQMDDGKSNGGTVKAFSQGSTVITGKSGETDPTASAAATSYVDDGVTLYTVCKTI